LRLDGLGTGDRMKFYAHSTEDASKSDWQVLSDHLMGVGRIAADRAKWFGGESLASVSGLLHDLGKYTDRFQARLEGGVPKVDHSTWGAVVAQERFKSIGTLLAYAIAGHHAGLANGRPGEDGLKRAALWERLGGGYCNELPPLLEAWEQEIRLPERIELPKGFKPVPARGMFQLSLLTRMVFSCLVDADFVDTDDFYRRIEGKPARDVEVGANPSLEQLREKLDLHLASLPSEGGINPLRSRILAHVRGQAVETPGLFSLTVPTGGGKTLASLAFALDHAIAHGLRRVIYVIPFTSIIEQNARVFREAFGELGEAAVLEHHSAFFDDTSKELQSIEKRRLAMENWDAPVIVTTAVQFFESLFADRPSRCRKLHNIAGSVVILDEAQTLPLHLLHPCVALLDELALNYRTSIVLCTATQPALGKEKGFRNGLENVRELAPKPAELYEKLRRVGVRHAGTLDDAALAAELRQRDQVLCILNNRRHARHVFEAIADTPGAFHLSTLMHARHRSRILDEVRARLKAGEPCRVVSTSLIEAGVDVDFPAVLRAEAGLDAIAQAAGRCNREGRRTAESSEVLVFASANTDWAPPPELKLFAEAFRTVERQHREDLLALEAVQAYFKELYWRKGDEQLDKHSLLGLLKASNHESLPLETLAAKFQMIESAMRPIIIPFIAGTDRLDPFVEDVLRDLEYAPASARKLQPYLVQVPKYAYDALWKARAIEAVAPDRYGDQFVKLVSPDVYDERFGLHWENPIFHRAESLMG